MWTDHPLPPKYYHLRQLSALSGALEGEGNVERLDNGAELLVGALSGDLLRHELAEHCDHREAAVLELLELLLTELLDRLRLESQEGGDLSRLLGVVLLVDSELVDADHRNDLEPRTTKGVNQKAEPTTPTKGVNQKAHTQKGNDEVTGGNTRHQCDTRQSVTRVKVWRVCVWGGEGKLRELLQNL